MIPRAHQIQARREALSTFEAEKDRLLLLVHDIVNTWRSPTVKPVATFKALRKDAGEQVMAELRARGYVAGWVWNGEGAIAFALDEGAAAHLDIVRGDGS